MDKLAREFVVNEVIQYLNEENEKLHKEIERLEKRIEGFKQTRLTNLYRGQESRSMRELGGTPFSGGYSSWYSSLND